jgi:F-type H+-transporting ATPase subunit b
MSLLVPDSGLLFWMLLSFIIVFVAVGKFGFPYITKAVEKRRENIAQSLQGVKEADLKISKVKEESDSIVAAANREQGRVLRDASDQREKIIAEAKNEAVQAAQKEINAAKEQIRLQKEEAIRDIRQ